MSIKPLGIAIAMAGAVTAAIAIKLIIRHKNASDICVEKLKDLRDDLELDCDLINSAAEEIPATIECDEDQAFKDAIDNAIKYATATLPSYAHLDDDAIEDLPLEVAKSYIDCLSALIVNAEKHIMAIDAAREKYNEAHHPDED